MLRTSLLMWAGAVALVPALAAAAPVSAEAALQAIRDRLIAQATEASTRVQTLAWIDDQGRLHESTRFSADAKVRGMRLVSPSVMNQADPQSGPTAVATQRAEACPPNAQYKRHALFVVQPAEPGRFFDTASISQLTQEFSTDLMALFAAETGWVLTQSQAPQSELSLYERELLHRPSDRAPHRLVVQLQDLGVAPVRSRFPTRPEWLTRQLMEAGLAQKEEEYGLLGIRVTLFAPETGQILLSERAEIRMVRKAMGYLDAPSLTLADPAQSRAALTQLQKALRDHLACDAPAYPVFEKTSAGLLVLRAGQRVGLRVGDRLLLSKADTLPRRALTPGVIETLALAEVISLSQDQATLKVVAGPNPPGLDRLVASPF